MIGYLLPVNCRRCDGQLEHVNGAAVAGTEAVALARCAGCGREWQVLVQLRPIEHPGTARQRRRRARAKVDV